MITTSNSLRKLDNTKGWMLNVPNLKARMSELGMNAPMLAGKLGCNRVTVFYWLNGTQQPSMARYLKLCEVLKVQP